MLPDRGDPLDRLRAALEGRYVVQRELGRGGMGVVYLAHEPKLDRPVALKLLPPPLAAQPTWRDRFMREARTAAQLSHPNIVPIHAVDRVGEFVFFTMAYVEGETLLERVRARGGLPSSEVSHILAQVARAVAYAHAQGVIHRDLKPQNIMLERGTDRALVVDFGIARVVTQADPAERGKIIGTYAYLSPEQALGRVADERSDVYSLGVVGYYAAAGRVPFTGATVEELLEQHVGRAAPPLMTDGGEFESPLAHAVDRCLRKDPDDRFQSAGELAMVLEPRPELPVPFRRLNKRLRETAGLSLVGVAASIGLLDGVLRGNWEEARLAMGAIGAMLGGAALYLLPATRRVLRLGYGREDIVRALRQDVERERQERESEHGIGARAPERLVARAAYATLGFLVLVALLSFVEVVDPMVGVVALMAGAGATLLAAALAAYRHHQRRDKVGERWQRFWESRLGEWAAALAGAGLKRLAAGSSHGARRAEESILASALRSFLELPDGSRRGLEDLPRVLERLQAGAECMRSRIGEGRTGESGPPDELAERHLADSITALEAVRLELQRLYDGTGTIEGVTAALARAREVGEAVDRLLEAREEVEEG